MATQTADRLDAQYRAAARGRGPGRAPGARPARRHGSRRSRVPPGPGHERRRGARAGQRLLRRAAEPEGPDPGRHARPRARRRRSSGSTRRPVALEAVLRGSAHVQDRPPGGGRRSLRPSGRSFADRPRARSAVVAQAAAARPAGAEHASSSDGAGARRLLVRDRRRRRPGRPRLGRRRRARGRWSSGRRTGRCEAAEVAAHRDAAARATAST